MKRLVPLLIVVIFASAGVIIFFTTKHISSDYIARNQNNNKKSGTDCPQTKTSRLITIQDGRLSPGNTQALRCDLLVITNRDDQVREIAFGEHDHHQLYNGVSEKTIKQGESFSVVLNQTGTYKIHDHLHDETQGTVTIAD